MLFTVVSLDDVFYKNTNCAATNSCRSTNPYDYIRKGWFLDNSMMQKGVRYGNFICDYSGDITGNLRYFPRE